jgi:predicted house-cleaning noncanonical NTP pyrophosphatase (MazG superfamily)
LGGKVEKEHSPEEIIYNKLVRDKIPEIIKADGKLPETRELTNDEVIQMLKQKAVEEAQELLEADEIDELKLEMSDVLEVLASLAERMGIEMSEVEQIRQSRAETRGRFEKGIFLLKTIKEF